MKRDTKKQATSRKAATVAKAVKAENDFKTSEELIAMDIKMYDSDSAEIVHDEGIERRIKKCVNRIMDIWKLIGMDLQSKEDVEHFMDLSDNDDYPEIQYILGFFQILLDGCTCLYLNISITFGDSILGIKQINAQSFNGVNIITDECFNKIDDNINFVVDKHPSNTFSKENRQIVTLGNKLFCSLIIDRLSIYFDAIDIERDMKVMDWFDNV